MYKNRVYWCRLFVTDAVYHGRALSKWFVCRGGGFCQVEGVVSVVPSQPPLCLCLPLPYPLEQKWIHTSQAPHQNVIISVGQFGILVAFFWLGGKHWVNVFKHWVVCKHWIVCKDWVVCKHWVVCKQRIVCKHWVVCPPWLFPFYFIMFPFSQVLRKWDNYFQVSVSCSPDWDSVLLPIPISMLLRTDSSDSVNMSAIVFMFTANACGCA